MSEAADPALIGRRIAGKFVVEKFLGGGSMGGVYRARDDLLERKVALKVMNPEVAVDPSYVSRFHREAKAASRLDHPNSMRVIEFGAEPDGLLYIAMEYLEGRDLYKVIHEDWPLSEARIADVMMKALAAISVAHEMGVIHRDLKPENIMILDRKDDEGQDIVKVCDFGIAKITETDKDPGAPEGAPKTAGTKLTTAGLVVGTPEYMSPEQARGEKLDARSDLYAMGIILYQLLTGRTPFMGESPLAVVLAHVNEEPAAPSTHYPGVHKGLATVCMHAIAKAKEERFQSARDMRAALKAAIEGRAIPLDTRAGSGAEGGAAPGQALPSAQVDLAARAQSSDRPAGPGRSDENGGEGKKRRSRKRLVIGVFIVALVLGALAVLFAQQGRPLQLIPSAPGAPGSVGRGR
jgi:serine/threonine-protein kinase